MTDAESLDCARLARLVVRRYACPPPGLSRADLVQEALLALLEALPRYDPATCGEAGAYLYLRARARLFRLARQTQQRAARERPLLLDLPAPPPPPPPHQLPDLDSLPRTQRAVLELTRAGLTDQA